MVHCGLGVGASSVGVNNKTCERFEGRWRPDCVITLMEVFFFWVDVSLF